MNSRRLGIIALRTAAFVIVAVAFAVVNGWAPLTVTAVALTSAALIVQLAGTAWLRRSERATTQQHPPSGR